MRQNELMNCPKCSYEIKGTWNYCINCGLEKPVYSKADEFCNNSNCKRYMERDFFTSERYCRGCGSLLWS